jgi:hypothetical protein
MCFVTPRHSVIVGIVVPGIPHVPQVLVLLCFFFSLYQGLEWICSQLKKK